MYLSNLFLFLAILEISNAQGEDLKSKIETYGQNIEKIPSRLISQSFREENQQKNSNKTEINHQKKLKNQKDEEKDFQEEKNKEIKIKNKNNPINQKVTKKKIEKNNKFPENHVIKHSEKEKSSEENDNYESEENIIQSDSSDPILEEYDGEIRQKNNDPNEWNGNIENKQKLPKEMKKSYVKMKEQFFEKENNISHFKTKPSQPKDKKNRKNVKKDTTGSDEKNDFKQKKRIDNVEEESSEEEIQSELSVPFGKASIDEDESESYENPSTNFVTPIRFSNHNWKKEKPSIWTSLKPKKFDLFETFCGRFSICKGGNKPMFPWIGLLLRWDSDKLEYATIRCGVTLISRKHAVSSADCVLKANIEPLYLMFGNFDFDDTYKDGIKRRVEAIVLVGDYDELAVLSFKKLIFHHLIRPICINASNYFKRENRNAATAVWNWNVENNNRSKEIVHQKFCSRIIRNDKKMAYLYPAKKCPKNNSSTSLICMKIEPDIYWSKDDMIPGSVLMYENEEQWFLGGLLLKDVYSNIRTEGKRIETIIFEDVKEYIFDLNTVTKQ